MSGERTLVTETKVLCTFILLLPRHPPAREARNCASVILAKKKEKKKKMSNPPGERAPELADKIRLSAAVAIHNVINIKAIK